MKKVFTVASEFDYRDTLHGDESQGSKQPRSAWAVKG